MDLLDGGQKLKIIGFRGTHPKKSAHLNYTLLGGIPAYILIMMTTK